MLGHPLLLVSIWCSLSSAIICTDTVASTTTLTSSTSTTTPTSSTLLNCYVAFKREMEESITTLFSGDLTAEGPHLLSAYCKYVIPHPTSCRAVLGRMWNHFLQYSRVEEADHCSFSTTQLTSVWGTEQRPKRNSVI